MAHPEIVSSGSRAATDSTIAFYDANADHYADATRSNDLSILYPKLLERVPSGGLVLDAGCGSGRDVLEFLSRGFQVEAFDASTRLAAIASARTGIKVEVQRFEDWSAPVEWYDGIWCFASLLHVSRSDLPQVLQKLHQALKPKGWLFASFKRGERETTDDRGRRYTNFTASSAHDLFATLGDFEDIRSWEEIGPSGLGAATRWVYVLARRGEKLAGGQALVTRR